MKGRTVVSKLSSLLTEGDSSTGQWSSTRFAMLFTVILSNIIIFGVWATVCVMKQEIIMIHSSLITLYGLANGITITGKVTQKHFEGKHTKQ